MTDEQAQTAVMDKLNDISAQIADVRKEQELIRKEQAMIRAAQVEVNSRMEDVESRQITESQVATQVEAAKSESAAYVDTKIAALSKRIDDQFKGLETRVMASLNSAVKSLTDAMKGGIERFEDIAASMRAQVEANGEIVRMNRADIKDQARKMDVLEVAVQSNDDRAAMIHRDLYGDEKAKRDGLISDWKKSQETISKLLKIQEEDDRRKQWWHEKVSAMVEKVPSSRGSVGALSGIITFAIWLFTYFLPQYIGG